MQCPNCGLSNADNAGECRGCSVVFEKWRAREARSTKPEPAAEPAVVPRASGPQDEPLFSGRKQAALVLGLAALGFFTWLRGHETEYHADNIADARRHAMVMQVALAPPGQRPELARKLTRQAKTQDANLKMTGAGAAFVALLLGAVMLLRQFRS